MKARFYMIALLLLLAIGFVTVLSVGAVEIPVSRVVDILFGGTTENRALPVIVSTRFSEAVVALSTGGALAVCGLVLQGVFRNPLAGPGVLGISSGAYFGVAIFLFVFQVTQPGMTQFGITAFGILGSFFVLVIIVLISFKTSSNSSLLIAGLMLSYVFSSLVTILLSGAESVNIQQFVVWGFGSFGGVGYDELGVYLILLFIPLMGFIFLVQPLNAFLLGENYASTLGFSVKKSKVLLFLLTGLVTGVATSFCGPIAFVGLATPHILRFFFKENDYRKLLPLVFLSGAVIALFAHVFTKWPASMPLNAITSFIGAPVVVYLLIKKKGWT